MFENYASTPDHIHLNSLEVAMHARTRDQKRAQMVAGYRKATKQPNRTGNFFRKILTTLITSFH